MFVRATNILMPPLGGVVCPFGALVAGDWDSSQGIFTLATRPPTYGPFSGFNKGLFRADPGAGSTIINVAETEAGELADRIAADRDNAEITFNGRDYRLGLHDINSVVNDTLEASGSSMRFVFMTSEAGKIKFIYGQADKEEKITIDGRVTRVIQMSKPLKKMRFEENQIGATDGNSHIIILTSNITSHFKLITGNPQLARRGYKESTYNAFYSSYSNSMTNGALLAELSQIFIAHELGHEKLRTKYGREHFFLRRILSATGDFILHYIDELFADLSAVEYIIKISRTDEKLAKKLLAAWIVYRNSAIFQDEADDPFERCIVYILLSACRADSGNISVDWRLLAGRIQSLKAVVEKMINELTCYFYLMMLGDMIPEDKRDDFEYVSETYNAEKLRYIQILREKEPGLSQRALTDVITFKFVEHLTGLRVIVDSEESTVLENFSEIMRSFGERINSWLKEKINLSESLLPF